MPDDKPKKRTRKARPFPACSFSEALTVGEAIQKYAAGQKVRRLTLFDNLKKLLKVALSVSLLRTLLNTD